MPKCKYCHQEISRLDKDCCPKCGARNPIEEDYKTKDMTKFIDPVSGSYKLYASKSKTTMGILMALLGMFGAPYFYINKAKYGIISCVVSIVMIAGLGSILFFLVPSLSFWGYLIPLFVLIGFWLIASIFVFKSESIKDGHGEFLR